jgi:hypothetical protein
MWGNVVRPGPGTLATQLHESGHHIGWVYGWAASGVGSGLEVDSEGQADDLPWSGSGPRHDSAPHEPRIARSSDSERPEPGGKRRSSRSSAQARKSATTATPPVTKVTIGGHLCKRVVTCDELCALSCLS